MNNTITICLNGKSAEEIEQGDFFHSLSWEAIMPTINKMVSLRPWEKIDGLIISSEDIRVQIAQKPGRKSSLKKEAEEIDTPINFKA